MSHEIRRGRNLYKEYLPGNNLSFSLRTLKPDGTVNITDQAIVIGDVRGGGFFGRVIIPQDEQFVIKTSLPDPWHHLWRTINWDFRKFPAQTEELAAQTEHLSTRLIHAVLPVLSDGKFYSPDSYGYTGLPTGYGQVVEHIDGRPPRFDLPENEFLLFRNAQQELLELGTKLGLEQVAQIHPDNPFGMANLWFNDKKRILVWLDTIPAIPHKGWVWPAFYFRFHKDVRQRFGQQRPTFNKIHTEAFRQEIKNNRHLFSDDVYEQVLADLNLYDSVYTAWEQSQQPRPRQRELSTAARAIKETGVDAITERAIYKLLADPTFRREKIETLVQIVRDPEYRVSYFNREVVLKGVERAYQNGIITKEELKRAWQTVETGDINSPNPHRKKVVLASLQLYYFVSSQILNALEASAYLNSAFTDDKASSIALGLFIGWVLPSILRPAGTLVISAATKTDLKVAARLSAFPKVGAYLAVPGEIGVTAGNKSEQIWHYTVRNIIASLSRISPSGGSGTQFEGELWNKIGNKLEEFGQRPK